MNVPADILFLPILVGNGLGRDGTLFETRIDMGSQKSLQRHMMEMKWDS